MQEESSQLEKLILKQYKKELDIANKFIKDSDVQDFEYYVDIYIDTKERLDRQYKYNSVLELDKLYKKHLALYTTNSIYENYLNHKNES